MGFFGKLFGRQDRTSEPTDPPPSRMGAPRDVPEEWGWYRMHIRSVGQRSLGYYYRDRQAGPSFNTLVDLASPLTPEQIRDQAAAAGYRGSSTFRLPAHETINTEHIPEDFAALMRARYEQCEEPVKAVLLKLTSAERAEYGLPDSPDWIAFYL